MVANISRVEDILSLNDINRTLKLKKIHGKQMNSKHGVNNKVFFSQNTSVVQGLANPQTSGSKKMR